MSSQLSSTYDDACDAYYYNTGGSNPCTPGGNDCASMSSGGYTFCCFSPPPGSLCDEDYYGQPQCIPQ